MKGLREINAPSCQDRLDALTLKHMSLRRAVSRYLGDMTQENLKALVKEFNKGPSNG